MYQLLEIPCTQGASPGITYVVTESKIVVFTREYTRHVRLVSKSPFSTHEIAWGGIMDMQGNWVRRSFDFGDAPSIEEHEVVVSLIQRALFPASATKH